jgi:hypothetical protein
MCLLINYTSWINLLTIAFGQIQGYFQDDFKILRHFSPHSLHFETPKNNRRKKTAQVQF